MNRGFEGGQSNLAKRFPKRGFRQNRFNIKRPHEQLNLGKLAYHISKGQIDVKKTITMKDLQDSGCITSIKYGVKLLSKGAEKISELGVPLHLEISDASMTAIETIR